MEKEKNTDAQEGLDTWGYTQRQRRDESHKEESHR